MFKKRLAKGVVSKPLKEMPTLSKKLQPVWEAFQILNQTRNSGGFSISPISYSTIIQYLNENEITHKPTRKLFVECILEMDAAIIKHHSKKDEFKDS